VGVEGGSGSIETRGTFFKGVVSLGMLCEGRFDASTP
jgi:hypothetical protein